MIYKKPPLNFHQEENINNQSIVVTGAAGQQGKVIRDHVKRMLESVDAVIHFDG